MRFISKLAIICASTLVAASPALAADRPTGTYLSGGIGANIANDSDVSGSGINTDIGHENGIAGILALGHAYANGIRGEFEVGRRHNSIDQSGTTSTGGSSTVLSAMINGYYDFARGSAFIPYLGAGIGYGNIDMNVSPVGSTAVNDSGSGLALQGIAGIGYQMTDSWTGTLEYRYFRLQGADINTLAGSGVDVDYDAHTVMVGLRYTFGAEKKPMAAAPAPAPMPMAQKKPEPAPPPAPQAPPPVARNYIVFFDWDKADITDEALAILKSAAENARKGNISRIQATGHADTSGTRAYNTKLSERRARAVQAQLNKLGIATNQIGVDWKGELQPLVPTADGVREPQNRRVEIVFP
ncbi:OmpA family protein [Thalassospiraceae bacterium LMO-JJ14]|nr:OmpA family protein [Thalassospiraceae bacterium LMO-JJ14]